MPDAHSRPQCLPVHLLSVIQYSIAIAAHLYLHFHPDTAPHVTEMDPDEPAVAYHHCVGQSWQKEALILALCNGCKTAQYKSSEFWSRTETSHGAPLYLFDS